MVSVSFNFHIYFDIADDIEFLETDVLAEALGIPVHFPLPKPCDHLLSGKCPIAAGDRIVYQLKMPILKLYPLVSIIYMTLT